MKPKNKAILFLASVESLMQLLLNHDYSTLGDIPLLKNYFICLKRDDVTNSIT